MGTRRNLFLVWLLSVSVLVGVGLNQVVGCAATPEQTYANVQDAFIVGVEIILDARDQGLIDETEYQENVLPFINAGNKALDEYWVALKAEGDTAPALQALQAAFVELRPYILKYQS